LKKVLESHKSCQKLNHTKSSKEKDLLKKKPFSVILLWSRLRKLIEQETCTLQRLQEISTPTWPLLPRSWSLKFKNWFKTVKFHQNMFTFRVYMLTEFIFKIQQVFIRRKSSKNSLWEKSLSLAKNWVQQKKLNSRSSRGPQNKLRMAWMST